MEKTQIIPPWCAWCFKGQDIPSARPLKKHTHLGDLLASRQGLTEPASVRLPTRRRDGSRARQLLRKVRQGHAGSPALAAPGAPRPPFQREGCSQERRSGGLCPVRCARCPAPAACARCPVPGAAHLAHVAQRGSRQPGSRRPGSQLPPGTAPRPPRAPLRSGAAGPAWPRQPMRAAPAPSPRAPRSERARRPLAAAAADDGRQRAPSGYPGSPSCAARNVPPCLGSPFLGREGRAEALRQELLCKLVFRRQWLDALALRLSPNARRFPLGGFPEHPCRGSKPSPGKAV